MPTIENLNQLAGTGLDALWRATWQGTVAAALVWVCCLCFRKIPQSVRNVLWWLVCAKMLLALAPISVALPVPGKTESRIATAWQSALGLPLAGAPSGSGGSPSAVDLAQGATGKFATYGTVLRASAHPKPTQSLGPAGTSPSAADWRLYAFGAWLLGAAACAIVSLTAFARACGMRRRALACQDPSTLSALAEAAARAGLGRRPELRVSTESKDVLTLGFIRPAILVPRSVIERCSTEELGVILAHECIHIRRGDPQLGLIPQVAQIGFFFNPLVWLATREYTFSREAVCDQAAMTAAQIGPDRYGRLLLALGARQDRGRTLCLPGVSSHFQLLRRRIAMLDRISTLTPFHPGRSLSAALGLTALLCVLPISLVQGRSADAGKPKLTPIRAALASKHLATHVKGARKDSPKVKALTPQMTSRLNQMAVVLKTDSPTANRPDGPTATVFSLQYAKAADAATTLKHLYKSPDLAIIADPRTNAIIIHGTKAETTEVTGVLTNLDQPTPQETKAEVPRTTQLFRLMYAHAESIADILRSTVGTHSAVAITFDPRTNSIIAVADASKMATIEKLLRELDTPGDLVILRRIKLVYGQADEILRMATAHLPLPKDYKITVDSRDNSLVVTGTEDEINHIQQVISVFDFK